MGGSFCGGVILCVIIAYRLLVLPVKHTIMPTAVGRTVFVLGKELHGNRQALIVENGEEYSVDISTMITYTDQTARFPYEI